MSVRDIPCDDLYDALALADLRNEQLTDFVYTLINHEMAAILSALVGDPSVSWYVRSNADSWLQSAHEAREALKQ